jgi:hypothetical protein
MEPPTRYGGVQPVLNSTLYAETMVQEAIVPRAGVVARSSEKVVPMVQAPISSSLRRLSRSWSRSKNNVGPTIPDHVVHERPCTRPPSRSTSEPGSRQSGALDYYFKPEPPHTICVPQALDLSELSLISLPSAFMAKTPTPTLTTMTLLLYLSGLPGRGRSAPSP